MNQLELFELCIKYPEVVDLLIKQSEQIKELQQAFDYLGNITGDSSPEELITALFTKFCLGK